MTYSNRADNPGENDRPHILQRREHEHADKLQEKLQQRDHEHEDVLQAMIQQRDHEHADVLQQELQRREHAHQHALLDPFPTRLALIGIVAAIVLNGVAMLLLLGHATPAKMAPFAVGLVAAALPTALAWTAAHKGRSGRVRFARHVARLLWLASIALFAIGGVFAAA